MGVLQQTRHTLGGDWAAAAVDILGAAGALAECSAQLEHEPLKAAVGSATQELFCHIEGQCRNFVSTLLQSLDASDAHDIVYDKLWTLRAMCHRSEVTRRWVCEAEGLSTVAKVMKAYRQHQSLLEEAVWLGFSLADTDAFSKLFKLVAGCQLSQAAIAWAIVDLARRQRDKGLVGATEWSEADELVVCILEALDPHGPADLVWGCLSALRELIDGHSDRAMLFVSKGGAEVVLRVLKNGQEAGRDGSSLMLAGMQLIPCLVQGNAAVAQTLRSLGALEVLVASGLALKGKATETMMWALGQVGGILAVLQVMSSASSEPGALESGLETIARLAWKPLEEAFQSHLLQVAEALLNLAQQAFCSDTSAVPSLQALGGVLNMLTPYIEPGKWQVLDEGVAMLIEATGPKHTVSVVSAAVSSMGHIAASSQMWRAALSRAVGNIQQRMRRAPVPGEADAATTAKHQRELFWTFSMIAGIPGILEEMRSQMSSAEQQAAALAAIVDTLEANEDEPASCGRDEGRGGIDLAPEIVNEALATISASMRTHVLNPDLLWFGCRAMGLLHQHMPPTSPLSIEALDVVLATLKQHPELYQVRRGAAAALRCFLEPRGGRCTAATMQLLSSAVEALRARQLAPTLRRILESVWEKANDLDREMLEDVLYILGLVDGLDIILQVMANSGTNATVRSASLTTLFELIRTFPEILSRQPSLPCDIRAAVHTVALETRESDMHAPTTSGITRTVLSAGRACGEESQGSAEILRRAELLLGMVGVA